MLSRKRLLKNKPLIIGGPCSVASREQILRIAKEVKKAGAHAIRAQLWKPRTKPDSFQGVGKKGIPWIKELKEKTGLPVVMEMVAPDQIGIVEDVADILWVGARNMQNYELLKRMKDDPRPVILKRGLIATVKEWLGAAEYIGKDKVILCERGIRTGADAMRFTLDLNAMLVVKHDHKMPVIVDPSHTAGRRDMVPHLALSAIAAGADGLVVETHYNPEEELVDKDQTITSQVFKELVKKCQNYELIV
jgi:3-deoxy-7-phosphoheptulonate synthase